MVRSQNPSSMKKMEARDGGESSSACKTATSMAIDPEIRSSRAIAKGPRNVSFPDYIGYLRTATVRHLIGGIVRYMTLILNDGPEKHLRSQLAARGGTGFAFSTAGSDL